MPRYNKRRNTNYRNKGRKNKRKVSRSTELKRLAYNMGQVEKGLKNPNSQISSSFQAGKDREKTKRKPLF